MRIVDDGRGFDVAVRIRERASEGHYGLMGLQERAELIGAQLDLVAAPGKGTAVVVRLARLSWYGWRCRPAHPVRGMSATMMYRFATEREDHTDLASGRVLQAVAGEPALPVRLTDEVFQRCLAALGTTAPLTLYDPCCGAAYHLTVLGFLHPQRIARILASEIQPALVEAARRNLSLLRPDGLDQRRAGLERLLAEHGKPSHREALGSLERLRQRLSAGLAGRGLTTDVFGA